MVELKQLTLGAVSTNCYVLGDSASKTALVIDPADDGPTILEICTQAGWEIIAILLTHAHFDHILALRDLKQATHVPIYAHADSIPLLQQLPAQMQYFFGHSVEVPPLPDQLINDSEQLHLGSFVIEVRYTPGHAPGHVTFVAHDRTLAFCGDCIMQGTIGRTDLPGGDLPTLMRSIMGKILNLPSHYQLAPGHMGLTTVGEELTNNPFVLDWQARR